VVVVVRVKLEREMDASLIFSLTLRFMVRAQKVGDELASVFNLCMVRCLRSGDSERRDSIPIAGSLPISFDHLMR
jgi:hypothetical protein